MDNSRISADKPTDKQKNNELIYYSAIIIELLGQIEYELLSKFQPDMRIERLIKVKNKWIKLFLDN